MAGKNLKQVQTAPVQEYTAVPITDAAEIAELEAKIKRYEDAERPVRTRGAARLSKKSTACEALEQARQLSANERFLLVTELAAQLTPVEQRKIIEQLTGRPRQDAHP